MFGENHHMHWIAGRGNILSKNLKYIYFQVSQFFLGSVSRTSVSCDKNVWNNFFCIVLLSVWAQKVCLRFLISYFKLEPSWFLFK